MFIDQEWKKENKEIADTYTGNESPPIYKNPYFIIGATFFASVFLIIIIILAYLYKPNISVYIPRNDPLPPKDNSVVSSSSPNSLPIDISAEGGENGDKLNFNDLQAEYLHFGQFYQFLDKAPVIKTKKHELPFNVKSDVVNYYDLSRKIDLTKAVEELNDNGFAVLENQLNSASSNFYTMHRELERIGAPLLISTDMVWYYHQNSLKNVFKEIEKNVFYDYVWDISKQLYEISLARYKKTLLEIGLVNDVRLEAQRQETAYLATALALLRPKNDQIIWDKNFVDDNLFSAQESEYYFFDMQPDIARDVQKEINYIESAKAKTRSPIMLYDIDYSRFWVPKHYAYSAKLKNYFLATQWLKNSFPLYYKSEKCPDCDLDYNDWRINFSAAHYLAKDLSDNQELKNKWAVVYKFIAFFEGLKSELTYLHYDQAIRESYSEEYEVNEIFSDELIGNRDKLEKMQDRIAQFDFFAIEGGIDRQDIRVRKDIGMRLLQTHFWPDDYLSQTLSGQDLYTNNTNAKDKKVTICGSANQGKKYRCSMIGQDILSVLDYQPINNEYYNNNTDYIGYEQRIALIKNQLLEFDIGNWNSNVYWINHDLAKTKIGFYEQYKSDLSLSDKWREKIQNSILGAWVNVSLPDDELQNYEGENNTGLGQYIKCNEKNYIEPNLAFYRDLLARGNMLYDVINVLPVRHRTNVAAIAIKDLNSKIKNIIEITEKQLLGEALSDNDCNFMADFSTGKKVARKGDKVMELKSREGKNVPERIEGSKLLVLIYSREDQNIAAVGPIFNYQEGAR
jgi:hypothetical protein